MVEALINLFRPYNNSDLLVLGLLSIPLFWILVLALLTNRNWRKIKALRVIIDRYESVHQAINDFMAVMVSYLPQTTANMTVAIEHIHTLNLSSPETIGHLSTDFQAAAKALNQIVTDNPNSQARTDSKVEILYGERPNPFKSWLFWLISLMMISGLTGVNFVLQPQLNVFVQAALAVLGFLILAITYRRHGKSVSLQKRSEQYASQKVALFNIRREFIHDTGRGLLNYQVRLMHYSQELSGVPQARGFFNGLVSLAKLGNATISVHRISDMAETAPLFAVDVALGKLVQQKYEPKAKERHLTLDAVLDKGLAWQVKPRDFEQAMHALVANAITYTKPGGKIAIRGKRRGDSILISVTDTGDGIAANDLPYLFVPLHKPTNDQAVTPKISLDLQVCKVITNRFGGELKIASKPGKGTIATLVAPRKRTKLNFDIPRHVSPSTSPLN